MGTFLQGATGVRGGVWSQRVASGTPEFMDNCTHSDRAFGHLALGAEQAF